MEEKINHLLEKMTAQEKASLTAGSDLWHTTPVKHLGIPKLKLSDGPNGVRGQARDTHPVTSASFPVGAALAATWNPDLVEEIGRALGDECHSKGVHVLLGPTVNTPRSPLAGRNFECFSEDPYLSSRMAVSYIRGVQSKGVAACVKHFVCNDQETNRFSISAELSERVLHETYLPPFKAAVVEAGVFAVMSAYNRLNGVYTSEHHQLLRETLKKDWKFDGIVISDWYGTYSQNSALNGCDLEMPGPARWMGEQSLLLKESPRQEILNDQVRRLLRTLYRTHAFETESGREKAENDPIHRDLIKKAGAEAIVLLKNAGAILPLDPDRGQKIALIGQLAEEVSFQGGGSSQVAPHYVVSPLEALSSRFPGQIDFARGYDIHRYPPPMDDRWLVKAYAGAEPLSVTYFGTSQLKGKPVHRATCQMTSLSWFGETSPYWDPKNFSMKLEGFFQPPQSGDYTLTLSLIGRGRLLIDHEVVLDLWASSLTEQEGKINLALRENRKYAVALEYASEIDVRWRMVRLGVQPVEKPDLFQEAVVLAEKSDLALVVVGLTQEWESEGFDRESLELPGDQDLLVHEISRVCPNTIVVLHTGSPVIMPWLDDVQAVLQAWYLGQETGNALLEVLTGKQDPGGRLPITFPADIIDTPTYPNFPGKDGKVQYREGIFIGYRHYDNTGHKPLFPFGYGLSYTSFEYKNLQASRQTLQSGLEIIISVEVTNTGHRAGWEVVQLYLHDVESAVTRPPKELKRFRKVSLQPGETAKISFHLDERDLAYYHDTLEGWVVESGEFVAMIGRSSEDIVLQKSFQLRN